ncbi:D-glycero-alpha-D-manno-heptose-1,7-bisphosphate 7-phosphatase [Agaribacterium sp. ZY112]|uniref:D-glycero-alpha-D-manno-heptose-1,7-bisphosphate 7-phosphatase n=1 Tax=Agaribacterium sp. ZY112 TaxID=3233574 RepID=UPI0035235E2E
MKVLFLDRDGVVNEEVNYLYRTEDFRFARNALIGIKAFVALGYQIAIVTNQAGIARGYYTEEDYRKLTEFYLKKLEAHGVPILTVAHCPHHPEGVVEKYSYECDCRKPKPGMIDDIVNEWNVNKAESIMVGDKLSDIEAGLRAGIENCFLVETGHDLPHNLAQEIRVCNDLIEVSELCR